MAPLESNPYLERVVARMRADDAYGQLRRHWSARAWWLLQRPGYWAGRLGLESVAQAYTWLAGPLERWLSHRQQVFLRRWL